LLLFGVDSVAARVKLRRKFAFVWKVQYGVFGVRRRIYLEQGLPVVLQHHPNSERYDDVQQMQRRNPSVDLLLR
jgi:hypothetical protein